MKANIKTARAYSTLDVSENEAHLASKLPERNYQAVVDTELVSKEHDLLVLQSCAQDILNFKTHKSNVKNYTEYIKQQTVVAAQNLFSVAQHSLQSCPKLKKVIIMKQVPRYDSSKSDLFKMKDGLVKLYTDTLLECKATSPFNHKIFIGSHSLDCTGGVRES